jgi:uncharacterized protein (DUF2267 family)
VKYDDMVRSVAAQGGLTRRAADESIVATLSVLAERVTAGETRDLLAQLPKRLQARVEIPPQPTSFRPDEFVERVARRVSGDQATNGEARVRAVFSVLVEAVNAGEMRDIAEQLGDDYAPLLGRPQRDRSQAARAADVAGAVVATVTRTADAALDAARTIQGRACDRANAIRQRVRTTVGRVPTALTQRLQHTDAVEDSAEAVEGAAERTAARFEQHAPVG